MAMLQNIQPFPLSCQKDGSELKRETNSLLRTDLIIVAGRCSFSRNELLILKMFCIHVRNEHMAYNAAKVSQQPSRSYYIQEESKPSVTSVRTPQVSLGGISITKSGILLFHFGPVTFKSINTFQCACSRPTCNWHGRARHFNKEVRNPFLESYTLKCGHRHPSILQQPFSNLNCPQNPFA